MRERLVRFQDLPPRLTVHESRETAPPTRSGHAATTDILKSAVRKQVRPCRDYGHP
jgi:hypothetical protein